LKYFDGNVKYFYLFSVHRYTRQGRYTMPPEINAFLIGPDRDNEGIRESLLGEKTRQHAF